MTPQTPTPPREPPCLFRPYSSSQKGGTLIAADVQDVATHMALLRSIDGYRPERCPKCGCEVMHVHDYRTRLCQLEGAMVQIPIVRHRCAHPDCGGQWQTLPGFVARHLHYNWPPVENECEGRPRRRARRRPSRSTRWRWRGRLGSSAARLVALLADAGRTVAATVCTRHQLLDALGCGYGALAAWVHALLPGARLM